MPSSHSVPNDEDQTLKAHTRAPLPKITRCKYTCTHLPFTASRLLQRSAWLPARVGVSRAVKEPRCLSGHVQYQAAACSRDRDRACSCAIAEAVTCAAISHSRCFGTVHTQTRTHTKSMHHSLCIHLATPSAPPNLTSTAPTRGSDSDRIATEMSTCMVEKDSRVSCKSFHPRA